MARRGIDTATQMLAETVDRMCRRLFDGAEPHYSNLAGRKQTHEATSPAVVVLMASVVEPLLACGERLMLTSMTPSSPADVLLCRLARTVGAAVLDCIGRICAATANVARPLCREDLLVVREYVLSRQAGCPTLARELRRALLEQE